MLQFGWKAKAEKLRMVIVSAGHQGARELTPFTSQMLEIYARVVRTGDATGLQEEMDALVAAHPNSQKMLWEPLDIGGWTLQCALYLKEAKFWWLVHATCKSPFAPSKKSVALLYKVLDHLGCIPDRHVVIGPDTHPDGEETLPFGWWTWQNQHPLFEIQVNKHKKGADMMRIVPLGSRATDGYESVDLKGGES